VDQAYAPAYAPERKLYSLLHIKAVDPERRLISGIATTPQPDRVGDVIDPLGVKFKNPVPLLLHHDKTQPVGRVRFQKPTDAGVEFEAELPIIDSPGVVRDRVNEAWDSIKAGLIAGVSIGFRVLDDAIELMKSGGIKFLKTEVLELSLVTVPANQHVSLSIVKELDLARSGHTTNPSAIPDLPVVRAQKDAPRMGAQTIPEQIASFENTRAAKLAEMNAIAASAAEKGETLDAERKEKYDELSLEIKSIDDHLPRLRELEKYNLANATKVTPTTSSVTASELRGGTTPPVVTVKPNVPKGTAFVRFAQCMASAKGDSYQAISRAKSYADSTPEVEKMVIATLDWNIKAAVASGTTTDATWAGPLAVAQPLVDEFLELLRPRTLIGRVPGFRQVPFNVSVPSQTGGGTYSWVGQGNAKPVTSAAFATVSVPFAKAAGIIVLTEELVRLSSPSAEATVREEMIAGMGAFLDTQLIDPAVAVVANVNPASITNGAATAAASGATGAAARADLAARVATFTAANIPLDGSVWLMSDSNAFGIAMSLNALGQPLFPGMSIEGGTIMGIPVVVSNNVGNRVILVHAPSILFADEGGVSIDVSREASIQMDSAPANPSDATTVLVSLWQRNLVGLRAERMITWIRARTAAVTYISAAAYTGA
jgi:HK97 family phage major capsid protein/HK97 family phage prohead protease